MDKSKFNRLTGLNLSYFKNDALSGIVVFLVALPLCLGIALASGAPLFSGIITGVVGGVLVAMLSGSQLAVSGPAAGLAVIVLNAIEDIGFFEGFLVAVVLAGVIQLVLGFLKAGTIGNYFPSSVIKGMLAAIGILLIIKQIPHAFGYDKDYLGDLDFWQVNHENALSAIVNAFNQMSLAAVIISIASLAILIGWNYLKIKSLKSIPAPLLVVFLGVAINQLFIYLGNGMALSQDHLVTIPELGTDTNFSELFTFPDFSVLSDPKIYTIAITIAIVASLETLLSIEAVDKLDPQKRRTPLNRELKAQGVGNIFAGLIGGLPMTAVIVRGSVNINSGAKTKLSAFLHGLFLMASVLAIPQIINLIPYASLAAILLVTGYKLANAGLFKQMYRTGRGQFYPFIITILAIVFTDLLIGIIIGLVVGILNILLKNMKNTYSFDAKLHQEGDPVRLVLSEEVTFLNKASMVKTLDSLPENSQVIIDASNSVYIDYDVLEAITTFKNEGAKYKDIQVDFIGLEKFYDKYN
ncbi:SulP family inorganic anion transporter [Marivirga sp. S37H4]|uniref:SulP family inorganic anion transporter n=1 Tax=Marivirga aurantiaca TaxID=2802615 RepID=A0A935C9Y8_9BACT|nr:SulP family inorganic anion transporter [Marivirga aurantiaca]MBK6266456.1 SulP family inorganic anion transporter [Marivirga aurantiaca]